MEATILMNDIVKRMLGKSVKEAAYIDHGDGTGTYAGPGYDKPTRMAHGGHIDLSRIGLTQPEEQEEAKEVELAKTILSAVAQLPDSPAKDRIVQAATELKQLHAAV